MMGRMIRPYRMDALHVYPMIVITGTSQSDKSTVVYSCKEED